MTNPELVPGDVVVWSRWDSRASGSAFFERSACIVLSVPSFNTKSFVIECKTGKVVQCLGGDFKLLIEVTR